MFSRWSQEEARRAEELWGERWGADLALRTYSSRLLGADPDLVLHGGGNTSLKGTFEDPIEGETAALFVKASGRDLATIEPPGLVPTDLERLRALSTISPLPDPDFERELQRALLDPTDALPSLEAPVHAVLPGRFVDHTHADAILTLTNRPGGLALAGETLGDGVILLPYHRPGHELARAVREAIEKAPGADAMVWDRHGLVTWGESARESFERTQELVRKARDQVERAASSIRLTVPTGFESATVRRRYREVAPVLRGVLAQPTADPDRIHRTGILNHLDDDECLALLSSAENREMAGGPPLTGDHVIRLGTRPLIVPGESLPPNADLGPLVGALRDRWCEEELRLRAQVGCDDKGLPPPWPRALLLPGIGAVLVAEGAAGARIARDLFRHGLRAKARIRESGATYLGLEPEELLDVELRPLQRRKLVTEELPLAGRVALVTGAAGAIGAGICRELLAGGAHVAATDLSGSALAELVAELEPDAPERIVAEELDVTDEGSVEEAVGRVVSRWGGIDLLVLNAGLAHVASLEELEPRDFRRLHRVNTEGTFLLLRRLASLFRAQGTGGDVVLISTKNVFAPGASFGAYSATKAAAHQLARIASQELAPLDVRVNMVAPDAVFGDARRPSGLWQEVGPSRMRARGLSPEELEEYYRRRNLLQSRVTPEHVGRAVVFFATRRTPTTGATLPVDGGLPDATPR